MNSTASAFPAAHVAPNPRHALGGIWRLTSRRYLAPTQWGPLLLVLGLLALLASAVIRDGSARQYFSWISDFYLAFLVPVMAFLASGGTIRDDLKAGAADYLLTRPVRRPLYLAFKYLAHLACFQAICLLGLGVMVGVAAFRHIPGIAPTLPWLLLGQVLTVTVFTALGFLCAVLTGRFLIVGLVYGAVVEVGVGNVPIQLNRIAVTHQVRTMLEPLLPYGPAHPAEQASPLATTGLLVLFALVLLAVAAARFSMQELAGARPSDT
ncbi:MAG TPA: ABC transporter permease subunit [Opitutaceae bacterium]|nr:ABC transporter permease subunit [Opitutaceae bacterium]